MSYLQIRLLGFQSLIVASGLCHPGPLLAKIQAKLSCPLACQIQAKLELNLRIEVSGLMLQLKSVEGFEPGQQLKVEEIFKVGEKVDVAGTTIGKGFQGGS